MSDWCLTPDEQFFFIYIVTRTSWIFIVLAP